MISNTICGLKIIISKFGNYKFKSQNSSFVKLKFNIVFIIIILTALTTRVSLQALFYNNMLFLYENDKIIVVYNL
jgi:hypothetical protein